MSATYEYGPSVWMPTRHLAEADPCMPPPVPPPIARAEIAADCLLRVDDAFAALLDRAPEELVGVPMAAVAHPVDVRMVALASHVPAQPLRVEIRLRRADGSEVPVLWSSVRDGETLSVAVAELPGSGLRRYTPAEERRLGFGTFDLDRVTGEVDCSDYLAAMLRSRPTNVDEARECLLADDRVRLGAALREVESGAPPLRRSIQLVTDTTLLPVDVWLSADLQGRRVRGTVRDMSLQHDLVEQLEWKELLLDAVDAAVIGTDLDGRVLAWNHTAQRLFGVPMDEARGRMLADAAPELVEHRDEAQVLEDLRTYGSWEAELPLPRASVHVRETLVPGKHGAPVGRAIVARDVTAQVRLQARLDTTRRSIETVAERMADGLFILDHEGRLTFMNETAEAVLGWRLDELRGRLMHAVTHHRRRDGAPFALEDCPITRARREDIELAVAEDAFIRRDGSFVAVSYTCAPFITEAGRPATVIVFRETDGRTLRAGGARDANRSRRVDALHAEIAGDGFEVLFQPIVDRQDAVRYVEVLARSRDSHGLPVGIDRLRQEAAELGLGVELGRRIMAAAAEQRTAGVATLVRIEPVCLDNDKALATFTTAAAGSADLVLALDETALLADADRAAERLARARDHGCAVALTCVGRRRGGFDHLRAWRFDLLGIDASIVGDLADAETSREVVRALTALAQLMGVPTLAPGVGDEATRRLVAELGVDLAQGSHVGLPKQPRDTGGVRG